MPDTDPKPGDRASVTVTVVEKVSTGFMCRLLDRTGEVQAMQVVPAACLNLEQQGNEGSGT